MKNVFKKLFSFMLVAVMLVSVLPVTAMAAEGDYNMVVNFVRPDGKAVETRTDYSEDTSWMPGYKLPYDDAVAWFGGNATKGRYTIPADYVGCDAVEANGVFTWTVPVAMEAPANNMVVKFMKPEGGVFAELTDNQEGDDLGWMDAYNLPRKDAVAWFGGKDVKDGYKIPDSYNGVAPIVEDGIYTWVVELEKYVEPTEPSEPTKPSEPTNPETKKPVTITFTYGNKTWTITDEFDSTLEGLTANAAQDYYEHTKDFDPTLRVVGSTKRASDIAYPFNGKTCDVKLEKIPTETNDYKEVVLKDKYNNVFKTIKVYKNDYVELPDAPKVLGFTFVGWFNDGHELKQGAAAGDLSSIRSEYKARYNRDENGANDGLSELKIKVALYSAGKYQKSFELNDGVVVLKDGTELLEWLYTDNNKANIINLIDADERCDGYQWHKIKFYNNLSKGSLTDQLEEADGDQTVYIRLDATDEKAAKVVLYVHSKLTDKTPDDHVITGYVKDGQIDRDDVWEVIKDEYKTSSKTKMDGLYTARTWEQKVEGQKPDAEDELTINTNGFYEVHVILTGATSKADSSNPKTGDNMFMIMTIMTLSATALAGAYIYNKKWMVK